VPRIVTIPACLGNTTDQARVQTVKAGNVISLETDRERPGPKTDTAPVPATGPGR